MKRSTRMLLMAGRDSGRQAGYARDGGRRMDMDEMVWRPGEARMGQAAGEEVRPLTREAAMEWTGCMENAYMARAFPEDQDAQPEKLARYWR